MQIWLLLLAVELAKGIGFVDQTVESLQVILQARLCLIVLHPDQLLLPGITTPAGKLTAFNALRWGESTKISWRQVRLEIGQDSSIRLPLPFEMTVL